jgi:8-oxo-dGTP pyrophosphatase MutT (NUDIX family)
MNDLAPAPPFPGDGGPAGRSRGGATPGVEVREAATLILVRTATTSLEVLMLRRHPQSVFAADAWVFPGGQVDGADSAQDVAALCQGPTDAEASATLGIASGGLAYWVAAARECFEEAGILLARPAVDEARLARHRRDLHAGRRTLAEVLAADDLVLDLGGMYYVSHWITPPGGSRRFDTRFFLAAAPPGQVASHDAAETVESVWTTPAALLSRYAAEEAYLVFPTIKNLETLARFDTVEQLLEAARAIGPVPASAPWFAGDPRTAPATLARGPGRPRIAGVRGAPEVTKFGGMRLQPPPDRSLHA